LCHFSCGKIYQARVILDEDSRDLDEKYPENEISLYDFFGGDKFLKRY
jgi:hypothetical protein